MTDQVLSITTPATEAPKPLNWPLLLSLCTVAACLVAVWLLSRQVDTLRGELAMRHPVIIIQAERIALQSTLPSDEQFADKIHAAINEATRKFSSSGYLVLSGKEVISAPEDAYLNASDLGLAP